MALWRLLFLPSFPQQTFGFSRTLLAILHVRNSHFTHRDSPFMAIKAPLFTRQEADTFPGICLLMFS